MISIRLHLIQCVFQWRDLLDFDGDELIVDSVFGAVGERSLEENHNQCRSRILEVGDVRELIDLNAGATIVNQHIFGNVVVG